MVILFGPPLTGKTTLAWQLARSFASRSAVISVDDLAVKAFAVASSDRRSELEMGHTQLRLLAANYLKNRYNLVIEGSFLYEEQGDLLDFQAEIDQLIQLMRHLAPASLAVQVSANPAALAERARKENRQAELAVAPAFAAAYKARFGTRFLDLRGDSAPPAGLAQAVREHLDRVQN